MELGSRSDRSLERLVRRQLPFGLLLLITTVRRRARRAALRSAPSVRRERFFLFVPAERKAHWEPDLLAIQWSTLLAFFFIYMMLCSE